MRTRGSSIPAILYSSSTCDSGARGSARLRLADVPEQNGTLALDALPRRRISSPAISTRHSFPQQSIHLSSNEQSISSTCYIPLPRDQPQSLLSFPEKLSSEKKESSPPPSASIFPSLAPTPCPFGTSFPLASRSLTRCLRSHI